MREKINLLFKDNLIKISIPISIVLILIQIIMTIFFSSKLPPIIPLLNSQPWGVERLYPASSIFFLPLSLIVIFLINNSLSAYFSRRNNLMARILSFNALLFIFLGVLAYIQIIFLVY